MSPDSPPQTTSQQPTRRTKILLPPKKPLKWSTGVVPGDYGGPPTTSKLRKYWGGEGVVPLESNEYIWNKDFVGRFKRMIAGAADGDSLFRKSPVKEEPSGILSLNRVMMLDSLDVDLSKELTKSTMATPQEPIASPAEKSGTSPKWRSKKNGIEQQRLLLEEVILVPEYGAMHLELVPMLIGFSTYKIATFAQAIKEARSGLLIKTESMDTALMKLVEILWVQLPRRMSEASFISSLEMSWCTSPSRIVPTFDSSCKKSGPGELSDCGTVICVPIVSSW